MLLSSNPFQT